MTAISRTTVRLVVPLILLTAISLLLQGHQLPGGGFIGGVMTAAAFALIYVVFDIDYLEKKILNRSRKVVGADFEHCIQEDYRYMFGAGLLLAFGTGFTAILFEHSFLTHTFRILHHVPVYGELELASAFAFDLGVYLVVVGGLLTAVSVVGEE